MKHASNPALNRAVEPELSDRKIIERSPSSRDSLIPLLQEIQEKNGFLSKKNKGGDLKSSVFVYTGQTADSWRFWARTLMLGIILFSLAVWA